MSTILQFRPKTISTKTIRRRLKDFQNGRKKKKQEVSEIHDCLSQLMLRLSWSKIYCSGMVMTYAKLNCVKVFVYIITMDILYVTIIILNGLKRYFCQRPPDWISTYKTTYIRQNRSFLRRPCVDCRENRELAADLWRHERTKPKNYGFPRRQLRVKGAWEYF